MNSNILEKKLKVLVVDDVPNNVKILTNFLVKNNYEIYTATNGVEGVEAALREKPDLILLDIMMPVMDGYDTCKAIRANSEISGIPIIFITAKNQQEDILKAFEVGGNDYVVKPFFFQEVLMRIKVHIENKLLREELFDQSMKDPLTGLWNRRYFLEQAHNEFSRSLRYNRDLSFVIMDIDNFKMVNDKYGHCAGDAVLQNIADFLMDSVRDADYVCRWGGEEFVILLPETKKTMAALLIERIRSEMHFLVTKTSNDEISATLSYGISGLCDLEENGIGFEKMYSIADNRLYNAKNSGKNTIRFE